MDIVDNNWNSSILEGLTRLLYKTGVKITLCHKDFIALDIDVSYFDNSDTKKKKVYSIPTKAIMAIPQFSHTWVKKAMRLIHNYGK